MRRSLPLLLTLSFAWPTAVGVVDGAALPAPDQEVGAFPGGRIPALSAVPGLPTAVGVGDPEELEALRASIRALLPRERWPRARWSLIAVSLDAGDTLFAEAPDSALVPASNVKLLTSAAALHHLGADYRFVTYLLADGPVSDGVLDGDLVLLGSGDPTLSDRTDGPGPGILDRMSEAVLAAGIHRVTGNVVGDATLFGGSGLGPAWPTDDFDDWYAAPATALSFNGNVVTLRVEAGAYDGARPTVHTIPDGAGIPIEIRAVTVRGIARRPLAIGRTAPGEPILVDGEIRTGGPDRWRRLTVTDPPLFAATLLTGKLRAAGIEVQGVPLSVTGDASSRTTGRDVWAPALGEEGSLRVLASHRSEPLAEILRVVNVQSNNLYAELILKAMGRTVVGNGSFEGGVEAVRRYLIRDVGLDGSRFHIADGSGLSSENRISAGDFVRVLRHLSNSGDWEVFWGTLPEAGNRRELGRMYRTPAAGNLRAKTGTLRRVSALTGLVQLDTGERIAFSFLSNDVPSRSGAKALEDRIAVRLASFQRASEPGPGSSTGTVDGAPSPR